MRSFIIFILAAITFYACDQVTKPVSVLDRPISLELTAHELDSISKVDTAFAFFHKRIIDHKRYMDTAKSMQYTKALLADWMKPITYASAYEYLKFRKNFFDTKINKIAIEQSEYYDEWLSSHKHYIERIPHVVDSTDFNDFMKKQVLQDTTYSLYGILVKARGINNFKSPSIYLVNRLDTLLKKSHPEHYKYFDSHLNFEKKWTEDYFYMFKH